MEALGTIPARLCLVCASHLLVVLTTYPNAMFQILLLITAAMALFNPRLVDGWAQLAPSTHFPGAVTSLPFKIGIFVDQNLGPQPTTYTLTKLTTGFDPETAASISKAMKTADVVQIEEGQIRRPEKTTSNIERVESANSILPKVSEIDTDNPVRSLSCSTNETLQMTLQNGILRDHHGRIGSIVASRQFQFDGPVPQHGAVFAAGWLVTQDGYLALGNMTSFYQCRLGDFNNLYDTPIAAQCSSVNLEVVELVECE